MEDKEAIDKIDHNFIMGTLTLKKAHTYNVMILGQKGNSEKGPAKIITDPKIIFNFRMS